MLIVSFRSVFAPEQPAALDGRLTDASQDVLVASLRSMSLRDSDLPVRPDFGTRGTGILMRANFFPVRVPKGPLHEYDVTIAPPVTVRRMKRRIYELAETTPDWAAAGMSNRVAHDYSSKLISASRLSQPLVITVPFKDEDSEIPRPTRGAAAETRGGRPKESVKYTLTIKFIQELETTSLIKYVGLCFTVSKLLPLCGRLHMLEYKYILCHAALPLTRCRRLLASFGFWYSASAAVC